MLLDRVTGWTGLEGRQAQTLFCRIFGQSGCAFALTSKVAFSALHQSLRPLSWPHLGTLLSESLAIGSASMMATAHIMAKPRGLELEWVELSD